MAVRTAPASQQITRDLFYTWGKNCKVRQIQKKYEEIAEDARKNQRSILVEMNQRGYKDFNTFNKSCEPFPLFCWPTELAELGSGFVLYFHFLALMALVFVVLSAVQVPAMLTYASHNDLAGWQFNEYHAAYSTKDPCECLGRNDGIEGLPGVPSTDNYGMSCSNWDTPWQVGLDQNTLAGKLRSPGLWVCRRWCFAAKHCPTRINKANPSISNVHVGDLVRAYSACKNDQSEATVVGDCPGPLSDNVFYNETGAHWGDDGTAIGSHWLTPGNLGPHKATNTWIPPSYLACIVVIIVFLMVGYSRMVMTEISVDADATTPNDFALMVRGLPQTATEEAEIVKWFSQHAVPGQMTEIAKVVIGFDVVEFRGKLQELKELKKRLDGTDKADPNYVEIQKRMVKVAEDLKSAGPDRQANLKSSGIVIVTFRYQHDMRACLNRWNTFWARNFYSDARDLSCFCSGNMILKGGPLPKFPIGETPACKIQVERAANPGDINWMELGIPTSEKYKRLLKTHAVMGLIILFTFFAVYGLNKLSQFATKEQLKSKDENEKMGFQALSILPALLVMLMNMLLTMAARKLGEHEYHETKTEEMYSQAVKMSIGMIINQAGVLMFLNAQPKEWYLPGGLIDNTGMMLLTNSVIPPFLPLFDMGYRMRYLQRRKLTDEKLDKMNEIIHRVGPHPTEPAAQRELKAVQAAVERYKNEAFAPSEIDAPRRYADVLKTTFCCVFFSPVMPVVSIFAFVGLTLQYMVDKYGLLRTYKRPDRPANSSMALFSMRIIKKVAPISLAIAIFVFLTPSWERKQVVISAAIIGCAIAASSLLLPLNIMGRCLRRCYADRAVGGMDYYQAQYMWSKEMKYHKDHFLYAKLSDDVNPEYLKPGQSAAVKLSDVKASYGSATQAAAARVQEGQAVRAQALTGGRVLPTLSSGSVVSASPTGARPSVVGAASCGAAGDSYVPGAAPSPTTASTGSASPGYVPGVASPGFVPGVAAAPAYGAPAAGSYVPGVAATPAYVPGASPGAASAPAYTPGASPGYVPGATSAPAYVPGTMPAAAGSAGGASSGPPTTARAVWEFQSTHDRWHAFAPDCHNFIERKYMEYKSGTGQPRIKVKTKDIELSVDFGRMTQMKVDTHKVSAIRRREA